MPQEVECWRVVLRGEEKSKLRKNEADKGGDGCHEDFDPYRSAEVVELLILMLIEVCFIRLSGCLTLKSGFST